MKEDKPDLPEHGESLPSADRDCPDCGASHSRRDRPSEREQFSKYQYRTDYWCLDCDAYVGTKLSYEGPEPVMTHNGWETH